MRETQFINKRKSVWKNWEKQGKSSQLSPEELRKFIEESSDDVSYARTHYPNRSVRLFLNNVLGKMSIGLSRKARRVDIGRFWLEEVPDAIWKHRWVGVFALLIFMFSLFVGGLSQHYDKQFAWQVLGDDYMQMTLENIAEGRPMGVYNQSETDYMFLYIALNNVKVMLLCMALGITFGVGTVIVMINNGIHIGAFLYFFVQKGLWAEAFFAVMMHGTIELSAVVLAGFTGLIIARGLLFPKTLDRVQSLILASKDALKIALALIPFTIVAAFIEGFFTRHTDMSYVTRGLFILACFLLVVGYFVILPIVRRVRGKTKHPELELVPEIEQKEFTKRARSISETFASSLILCRKSLDKALAHVLFWSAAATGVIVYQTWKVPQEEIELGGTLRYVLSYDLSEQLHLKSQWLVALVLILAFTAIAFTAQRTFAKGVFQKKKHKTAIGLMVALVHGSLIAALFFLPLYLVCLIFIFIGFLLYMGIFQTRADGHKGVSSMGHVLSYLKHGQYGRFIVVSLLLTFLPLPFFILLESELMNLLAEAILINVELDTWQKIKVSNYLSCFLSYTILFGTSYFSFFVMGFTLRHIKEMATAEELNASISLFGTKKRTYGLEAE